MEVIAHRRIHGEVVVTRSPGKEWTLLRRVAAVVLCVGAAGCSTVTINPYGTRRLSTTPTQVDRKSFFVFGLVGDQSVDVSAVCGTRKPVQMQAQSTFVDSLLGIVTLGIYAPRSVRIWCE
jgi:hypothetical protein